MKTPEGSRTIVVLGGAILYCTGGVVFFIIPTFLGDIGQIYKVSSADLGVLSAAELWAIAFASLAGPFWINRVDWRVLARVGALISLVGQFASLLVRDFNLLLLVRTFTGAFGEGLLLALSYSLLGQTRNVERSFGIAYGASVIISMICLYTSPQLDRIAGTISVLIVIAALSAAAFFVSFLIPVGATESTEVAHGQEQVESTGWRSLGALALLTQALWYAGAGGFWAFTEQLATDKAVPAGEIATAIAIGTGAALLGTLLAVGLSRRFGRVWPTAASILVTSAAVFAYVHSSSFSEIAVELAIFNACWASGTIYMTATACASDASGKVAVLVPAFQTIGMASGTFVLGHVIEGLGVGATPWLVSCFLAAALLLVLVCGNAERRRLVATTAGQAAAHPI